MSEWLREVRVNWELSSSSDEGNDNDDGPTSPDGGRSMRAFGEGKALPT